MINDLPTLTPTESLLIVAAFLAIGWLVLVRLFYPRHDVTFVKHDADVWQTTDVETTWRTAQEETRQNVRKFNRRAS